MLVPKEDFGRSSSTCIGEGRVSTPALIVKIKLSSQAYLKHVDISSQQP